MKRDTDLGWELIEHDPMLRLELSFIEQQKTNEEMVNSLMEFYARIERRMKLTVLIIDEETLRQEDYKSFFLFHP